MRAYALIDPHWGDPKMVLSTVSETRESCISKAVHHTCEIASLYSGATMHPFPNGKEGSWDNLQYHGFVVSEIEITKV